MFKIVTPGLSLSACLFLVRFILSATGISPESSAAILAPLYWLTNILIIPEALIYEGLQGLTGIGLPPAQIPLSSGGMLEFYPLFNVTVFSLGLAGVISLSLTGYRPLQTLKNLKVVLEEVIRVLKRPESPKADPLAHLAPALPPSPFQGNGAGLPAGGFSNGFGGNANNAANAHTLSMNSCIPSYQGQMREVSILFCDIRGYTALVEKYPPNLVIHQLNEYFTAMTQVIFENQGRLDKYMGDGLMAFFEPTDGSIASSAINSVRAARDMERVLRQLNKKWQQEGLPVLDIGIGINSGVVFIGNIGSHMKMDFTIIGDNVNLAARLEQMNKIFNTRIIVSESTWRWVKDDAACRYLGQVPVRGKQKHVKVYEILNKSLQPAATPPARAVVHPLRHALALKAKAGS